MKDKIYLRPKSDDKGNFTLVDQFDREVGGIRYISVSGDYDDVCSFSVDCVAMTEDGKPYINGKAK